MIDLHSLRRHLRQLRKDISPRAQRAARIAALGRIHRNPNFRRALHIAGYFGSRGEIDPMPLLEQASRMGKHCYLPVLHPFKPGRLWFCLWQPGDTLIPNRFGIPEPRSRGSRMIAAHRLDLVIVPLLGFDADCNRLGMGGGYYDRSFAFAHRNHNARRPFMLGLAYEWQRVDHLPVQPWDVPLDAVVTDRLFYRRTRA